MKGNMYKLAYQLNADSLLDYQLYMAIHSKKLQNRLIKLMISLLFPFILLMIFFKPISVFIIIALLALIFDLLVTPKMYWKTIRNKILNEIVKKDIAYHLIKVEIKENDIIINNGDYVKWVAYEDVDSIVFTKENCLLIYDTNQSLIIPLRELKDQHDEIIRFLHKKLPDKLRG